MKKTKQGLDRKGEKTMPEQALMKIGELTIDDVVKRAVLQALPKHLSPEKLLRAFLTSVQRQPLLKQCTKVSLFNCLITCAQLGLEPDQFLGQAYLIPFKNNQKGGVYEAQLMPGYRGYIALARRSGEVQSVSAQVVHENDIFALEFGINEKLQLIPADGDRGKEKGAFVIFKYKDGSHSFDYMPVNDIMAIARRSKTYDNRSQIWSGPWATDLGEMMKKTVIKRHAKLAPLSVEFQKAVALEERIHIGESQLDLMVGEGNSSAIAEIETVSFDSTIPEGTDKEMLNKFLNLNVATHKISIEEVKQEALDNPRFWQIYASWKAKEKGKPDVPQEEKKRGPGRPVKYGPEPAREIPTVTHMQTEDPKPEVKMAPGPCSLHDNAIMTELFCQRQCPTGFGRCEVWKGYAK